MALGFATGIGKSGLQDWLLQRITATILIFYMIFLTGFFISNYPVTQPVWKAFCELQWVRYVNLAAIMALLIHAWLGIWVIFTDYIPSERLSYLLRAFFGAMLFGYFLWSIDILWGTHFVY